MDSINPSAASSVPCPLVQRSNKVMAMVCERGPESKIASDNTRAAIRKMNNYPASCAGASSGATMRVSLLKGDAPHISATSSSSRWICSMPEAL